MPNDKCPTCGGPSHRDANDGCVCRAALRPKETRGCHSTAQQELDAAKQRIEGLTEQVIIERKNFEHERRELKHRAKDLLDVVEYWKLKEEAAKQRIEELRESAKWNQQLAADRQERNSKRIEELEKWVDDLQRGMNINCVYCGFCAGAKDDESDSMREILEQHVMGCPKHPLSKAQQRIEELEKQLHIQTNATKANADSMNMYMMRCADADAVLRAAVALGAEWLWVNAELAPEEQAVVNAIAASKRCKELKTQTEGESDAEGTE